VTGFSRQFLPAAPAQTAKNLVFIEFFALALPLLRGVRHLKT
jgi:hypothetical protein